MVDLLHVKVGANGEFDMTFNPLMISHVVSQAPGGCNIHFNGIDTPCYTPTPKDDIVLQWQSALVGMEASDDRH